MLAKYSLFSAIIITLFPAFVIAQQQDINVIGASFFQDDEDDKKSELETEFEKMELRLRELEDDFVTSQKSARNESKETGSDTKELNERIAKLEEALEEQGEALDTLDGAQSGLVFHSHNSPKLTFFGRIHIDYWAFPKAEAGIEAIEGENPRDRFNFRRMRIGVKGDLFDNMVYKYEGEFANGVATSYRDAYLGFKEVPYLHTVLFGNQKRPYNLDQLNSSNHNVFIERPFIGDAVQQDTRRLGVASYGVSRDLKRNWRFGLYNQQLTQSGSGFLGDHYQGEIAARYANTAWYDESSGGRGYFHWAVAGMVGDTDGGGPNNLARYRGRPEARSSARWLDTGTIAGSNNNMMLGLETVFNYGPTQFVAEYMRINVERTDAAGADLQFHGGYFYVSHFLTGEHMPWNRKTGTLGRVKPFENFFVIRDCDCNARRGWGAWQVAARYSYADFNDQDIFGGEGSALTLGLNWHWNQRARMQFNYINGDIKREPLGSGDYEIFGIRMMVDF